MAERDSNANKDENRVNCSGQVNGRESNDYGATFFMGLEPPQADYSAPPPYEPSMDDLQYQIPQSHLPSSIGVLQQRPTPTLVSVSTSTATNSLSPGADLGLQSSAQVLPRPCRSLVSQRNIDCNYNHCQQFADNGQNCKLPTYEEVELQKSLTDELFLPIDMHFNHSYSSQSHFARLMVAENDRLQGNSVASATQNNSMARQQYTQTPQQTQTLPLDGNGQESSSSGEGDSTSNNDVNSSGSSPLTFVSIDSAENNNLARGNTDYSLLGRDSIFAIAFLAAFLFNWIGFLMITCFCNTVAARYGALSGFGLSLAKWTIIVKNSTELASYEHSWLWWLIMVFGVLICVRAIVQYVSIKRAWRLLSANAQERLLFFY